MSYKAYTHPNQSKVVIKDKVKLQLEEVEPEIDLMKRAQYMFMIQRAFSEPFGYRRYEVKTIK